MRDSFWNGVENFGHPPLVSLGKHKFCLSFSSHAVKVIV